MNQKIIAQKAGVSTATVSNVINGNYHKVSQETVQKVRRVIEEMGYAPNAIARSLASSKSHIIGVVIPELGRDEGFSINPYNSYILSTLENYIRNRGYYMMMRCVGRCSEIIPLFSSWNVDGVIFLGPAENESEELTRRFNVPMVFLDARTSLPGIVNVSVDDRRGGYLSGRYLLERGHRRVAFVGPERELSHVVMERWLGFRDACREFGVEPAEEDYFISFTIFQHGSAAGLRVAQSGRGYTAVACASDMVAFGVMEGLRRGGLRVPEDVSVIGFDDLPECEFAVPKLTSLSQDIPGKASLAAKLLFDIIDGQEGVSNGFIEPRVTERDSVIVLPDTRHQ